MSLSFPSLVSLLQRGLRNPLPGTEAQLKMAPDYRIDSELASVEGKECREAAVLIPIFPQSQSGTSARPAIVLTVRRDTLEQHSGQISFPGGQLDAGESLKEAALRETEEEIGLPPDAISLIGSLTPLYIPPSEFCVYPFVGIVGDEPDFSPLEQEVERILPAPIETLLNPATAQSEIWNLRGHEVKVPFYEIEGETVWGATAMMLSELMLIIERELQRERAD